MKKMYIFIVSILLLSILNGCNNIPKNQMEYNSPTGQQINEQRDETNPTEELILETESGTKDTLEDKKS